MCLAQGPQRSDAGELCIVCMSVREDNPRALACISLCALQNS